MMELTINITMIGLMASLIPFLYGYQGAIIADRVITGMAASICVMFWYTVFEVDRSIISRQPQWWR